MVKAMELEEAIKNRRSIRKFKDKSVPREVILKLLDAAQWAPSACNKQLWKFILIESDEIKDEVVKRSGANSLIKRAPVAICVLYQGGYSINKLSSYQSAAAAIQNMLLAAHANGLGGVWLTGIGNTLEIKRVLNVPHAYEVIALVVLGYPEEISRPPKRKDVGELYSVDGFDFPAEATYPTVYSPRTWTVGEISRYRDNSIRATSPTPDSFAFGAGDEFKNECALANSWLHGAGKGLRLMELLPFAGTHTAQIANNDDVGEYHIFELSDEPCAFTQERLRRMGISREVIPSLGDVDKIPLPDESIDSVVCFQKLEGLPDFRPIVREVWRLLPPGGSFLLSFRNKASFYWPYYLKEYRFGKEEVWNYGPFEPITYFTIARYLRQVGFRLEDTVGLSLLPVALGRVTRGWLSQFCRLVILRCRKGQ